MREIILRATKEEMQKAMDLLEEELTLNNCAEILKMQFIIAFEELFVNIVHYAYDDNDGTVKMIYEFVKDEGEALVLKVDLIDSGIAYNPLDKAEPNIKLSTKERKIGGLGILMAKKFLNEIIYERTNNQNCLSFTKKLG
jgi:Anti-sigma regulatory factor (Ser/Thr protein kinase)